MGARASVCRHSLKGLWAKEDVLAVSAKKHEVCVLLLEPKKIGRHERTFYGPEHTLKYDQDFVATQLRKDHGATKGNFETQLVWGRKVAKKTKKAGFSRKFWVSYQWPRCTMNCPSKGTEGSVRFVGSPTAGYHYQSTDVERDRVCTIP